MVLDSESDPAIIFSVCWQQCAPASWLAALPARCLAGRLGRPDSGVVRA